MVQLICGNKHDSGGADFSDKGRRWTVFWHLDRMGSSVAFDICGKCAEQRSKEDCSGAVDIRRSFYSVDSRLAFTAKRPVRIYGIKY